MTLLGLILACLAFLLQIWLLKRVTFHKMKRDITDIRIITFRIVGLLGSLIFMVKFSFDLL